MALVAKTLPFSAGNVRDVGLILGSGRFPPGRGNGNPFQYCCLENSMDRGPWQAAVHRVTQSDMPEAMAQHGMHNTGFTWSQLGATTWPLEEERELFTAVRTRGFFKGKDIK